MKCVVAGDSGSRVSRRRLRFPFQARPRWLSVLLALAMLVSGLVGVPSEISSAEDAPAQDWERTGLTEPVSLLMTPSSGAFFARTPGGLLRSDDAGATWAPPSVPAGVKDVVVDPTDHTVLYGAGPDGIYKSTDDAATWALVLPTSESARQIAVSPADRNLVYAAFAPVWPADGSFKLLRTRDGGGSWEQIDEQRASLCGWSVLLLQPHPTDAARVFRTIGCYAGRNTSDGLDQSTDQGATWSTLITPQAAFPRSLVGGQGSMPGRFYLAANRDPRGGGSLVFRSDDDGTTWTEVLGFRGGGTAQEAEAPEIRIGGLAYDPSRPDRIFVGLNEYTGHGENRVRTRSRVTTSADGGQTWVDLGQQDPGDIADLAVGIDGQNLYLATDQGLWRLGLSTEAAP